MQSTRLQSDAATLPGLAPPGAPPAPVVRPRAFHLTMRDGTRIAVDLFLPPGAARGARVPTILHQTRYFRAVRLAPPFSWWFDADLLNEVSRPRRRFLAAGYAWVDVDVRGSGASFGWRPHAWSRDEVADGAEILAWIAAQPWSNGRVGATGVSYAGTAAEHLGALGHPALHAIAPRFSLYDVYTDIAFPGGIHLAWFTETWGRLNALIDRNAYPVAFAATLRLYLRALTSGRRGSEMVSGRLLDRDGVESAVRRLIRSLATGVKPVDDDRDGALLAAAVADHAANWDVHREALGITFRDDPAPSRPFETLDVFSPHHYADGARRAGIPILSVGGWLDSAYPLAAIKRFRDVPTAGSALVLGPWEHGGGLHVSPHASHRGSRFDHDGLLLAFFERHLRAPGDRPAGEARCGSEPPGPVPAAPAGAAVHYYTFGAERWQQSDRWPPPWRPETLYLAAGGALSGERPSAAGSDVYRVDPDTGTGHQARWNSLIGVHHRIGYPDRARRDERLCCWTSAALPAAIEVTGHPVAHLHVAADQRDAQIFLYLEEVLPGGRVLYVTEGMLRLLHHRSDGPSPYGLPIPHRTFARTDGAPLEPGRATSFAMDLLPVSWRFAAGSRVRLALAGADRDHFATPAESATLTVLRGPEHPSRLELPVAPSGT